MLLLHCFNDQVVLELQDDGKVTTSDDPPVDFGCLDGNFIEKVFVLNLTLSMVSLVLNLFCVLHIYLDYILHKNLVCDFHFFLFSLLCLCMSGV